MSGLLHVGNLIDAVTDQQLHELFARSGPVISAHDVTDAATSGLRGSGLMEMPTPALRAVAGWDLNGCAVTTCGLSPRADGWAGGN